MTAWTTPRTWATGEVVTETMLNTHVRDNLLHLKEHVTATSNVHGAPTGAYVLSTKHGAGRHLEYGNVTVTGSGGSPEYVEVAGTWGTAFAAQCTWAQVSILDAANIFKVRCSVCLRAISNTGFTVKVSFESVTGNVVASVMGMGN